MSRLEQTPADTILGLLDDEATALRQTDFDALAGILSRKEVLLSRITPGRLSANELRQISQKAGRNAALLKGTAEGLRAALRRLALMADPERARGVYDVTGRRSSLSADIPPRRRA